MARPDRWISGLASIPSPFATGGTALLACVLCLAALVLFHYLARSPIGLAMQAFASAPAAARGVGVSPVAVRTAAFVLAAAAAGVAGGLQAALTGFIAPSSFPFSLSILFLLVVVVGGAGRTLGPLIGSAMVVFLPELLAGLAEYRLLLFGAGLLIVLWAAPGGIAGALARLLMPRKSRPKRSPISMSRSPTSPAHVEGWPRKACESPLAAWSRSQASTWLRPPVASPA